MSAPATGFIHRFVAGLPGAPVLLLLHGTGGDENDLLPLGPMLLRGAALLSPRGRVLESGMPRFFRRIAEGVFDEKDLIARTHELADFVAAAAREHDFDPARVIAAGFSNGANIAASLLLLRPGVLRAAVLMSPMVPLEPEQRPDLSGTPVWIGAGRADAIARPEGAERLAALLRSCGADVTVSWHEGGHTLTPEEIVAARAWLTALGSTLGGPTR